MTVSSIGRALVQNACSALPVQWREAEHGSGVEWPVSSLLLH